MDLKLTIDKILGTPIQHNHDDLSTLIGSPIIIKGEWNAATNTPDIGSIVTNTGYTYIVSVSGNTNLGGVTDWQVKDWAVKTDTSWTKIDNSQTVTSVNGDVGDVVISKTDIGLGNVTNDAQVKLDQTTPQTITNGKLNVQGFQFNTNPTVGTFAEGKLYYDKDWKTLSTDIDTDVSLQIGQEDLRRVYNNTASQISNGQPVYTNGVYSGGTPNVVTIDLAKADVSTTSFALGVATQDIPSYSYGFITVRGTVNKVKTDYAGWAAGDVLYLSDSTAGSLTNVIPSSPSLKVRIGRVITVGDATTGAINVRINAIYALGDLADVHAQSPLVNQVIGWNGSSWVNANPVATSASSGVNFYNATPIITATSANNDIPILSLSKTPVTTAEQTITSPTFTNNTVISSAWLYNTAIDRTVIDAGTWKFTQYISVSSVIGSRSSTFTRQVYSVLPQDGNTITVTSTGTGTSRTFTASGGTPFATTKIDASATNTTASFIQTPNGIYQITARTSDTVITATVPTGYTNETTVTFNVWKKLFGGTSIPVTNVGVNYGIYDILSTQGPFNITTLHKIGAITFCTGSDPVGSTNMTSIYNGTSRNSLIASPLSTLHNDLAGIQGGSANDMYHLTSAQATIATQAASNTVAGYVTTGSQTFAGVKTFASFPETPSSSPSTNYQVANKYYVDSKLSGGSGVTLADITTDHTADASDWGKMFIYTSSTAANRTFNVTTAASKNGSAPIIVKNESGYVITIDPNSTETIDDSLTLLLGPNESIVMYSDNTNLRSL